MAKAFKSLEDYAAHVAKQRATVGKDYYALVERAKQRIGTIKPSEPEPVKYSWEALSWNDLKVFAQEKGFDLHRSTKKMEIVAYLSERDIK